MRRLRDVLERVAPPGVVEAGGVLAAWREVARRMGTAACPADFRSGRLTLYVATPTRAQELSLRAREIERAVNALLGAERVREVRVRAAPR